MGTWSKMVKYVIFTSILRCYNVVAGSRGIQPPSPWKITKYRVFSNTGRDPLKILATKPTFNVGPSAERHLAFRWRADDGPLILFGSSPPPSHQLRHKRLSNLDPL